MMLTLTAILLVMVGLLVRLRTRGLMYLLFITVAIVALVSVVWPGRRTL